MPFLSLDTVERAIASMFHIKTNVNLMENLQITKKLRAFWMRAAYACIVGIGILSMNGCSKTTDEQITPQTQTNSLVKEYNLKEVAKPTDGKKIIYLNDLVKASAFFQNLKIKRESGQTGIDKTGSRVNGALVLSHGLFTFLNGQTATINFNMQSNSLNEIASTRINNDFLTFTQRGDYVQMFKWGIIAMPNTEGEGYTYYDAPITIYTAVLMQEGWSSVQYLDAYEQANSDGNGTWEAIYVEQPYFLGSDLPVEDTWKPQIPSGN